MYAAQRSLLKSICSFIVLLCSLKMLLHVWLLLVILTFKIGPASWWLCDRVPLIFNSWIWNVVNYLISKENFLCRFPMHFANLWLLSCLLRGMFGWNFAFQVLLMPSLWIFLFPITTSVFGWSGVGSNAFVKTTHLPPHIYFLVSGGIRTGCDCLSFIPLLPDGNQLLTHIATVF